MQHAQLQRHVGIPGAVIMGLGSILGTGVFVALPLAAGQAGSNVLIAVTLAAIVALCNGLSSASLAAAHPVSGGTYEYGHRFLNPTAGFVAGWLFLLAKSASAATAALGFSAYFLRFTNRSDVYASRVGLAMIALITLTSLTLAGLQRARWINLTLVALTVGSLIYFILGSDGTGGSMSFRFDSDGIMDTLRTTAILFVAYTGYGRIATMGEEVHNPRVTIPLAVVITMFVTWWLYFEVGHTILGYPAMVDGHTLADFAAFSSGPGVVTIVTIGACAAMLGVLLNLILGLSRTMLAMGRRGDMPAATARLNSTHTTPTAATLAVAAMIGALVLIGRIKIAWSFSAFSVLVYYAITNWAALKIAREQLVVANAATNRASYWTLRTAAWLGLISCLALAIWIDWQIMLAGVALVIAGLVFRAMYRKR